MGPNGLVILTAELIARQVAPKATPGLRAVLILGVVLVVAAGVLGATLLGDLDSPAAVTAALLLAVLVLAAWGFFYLTLDELTQESDARNLAMGAVLDGTFSSPLQQRKVPRRRRWVAFLSLAGTLVGLGLSGAFWGVGWVFVGAGPLYAVIALVSLGVYLVGMAMTAWSWGELVTPPPTFRYPQPEPTDNEVLRRGTAPAGAGPVATNSGHEQVQESARTGRSTGRQPKLPGKARDRSADDLLEGGTTARGGGTYPSSNSSSLGATKRIESP